MFRKRPIDISSFFIAGINYKKSDASVRGDFAISNDRYHDLLNLAAECGINELFVLSTCNRTEIYGFANQAKDLAKLLCSQTEGSLESFLEKAYTKSGSEAINHLFDVAAGLDSQILGDYEIIGQIRQSTKLARERGFLGTYLERIINEVFQASKKIRTTTELSGGTVSVSYAAVQYIRQKYPDFSGKKVLLVGTGKIGTNTCRNLSDYLPGTHVTLVNRTNEKAKELAKDCNFKYACVQDIQYCINEADIILVATNADTPVILKNHFSNDNEKLIIDLSVPCNVDKDVSLLHNIKLVNVDELSKIKDETLLKRSGEIPKVKSIIAEQIALFLEWHAMRRYVPILKDVKEKLLTIQANSIFDSTLDKVVPNGKETICAQNIQRVINGMAVKMRTQNQGGCHYIQAINDFISLSPLR